MKPINTTDTPILIVDDNLQYSQLLRRMLQHGFGYQNITTVNSLEEGYSLVSGEPERFQMVFVDFRFPGGETGGDFLKRLQTEKLLDDKVAFLVTSEPSVENVKQAASAGAVGVVAKPFDRDELKKQIEKAERVVKARDTESF